MVEAELAEIQQWWDTLTEDQQTRLKRAVQSYPADGSLVDLLLSSPVDAVKKSWIATSIADSPHSVTIHDPLKSFVESKIDDE
ncbi:hypothetical protein C6A88_23710 [Mycolicibacterium austroafricanum]|nr:hypothetical protein C6A88_23710 [Mycolicibacterium austroafricanum]